MAARHLADGVLGRPVAAFCGAGWTLRHFGPLCLRRDFANVIEAVKSWERELINYRASSVDYL